MLDFDRLGIPRGGKVEKARPAEPHLLATKVGCLVGGASAQALTISIPVAPLGAGKVGCFGGKNAVKLGVWIGDKIFHEKFDIAVLEREESGYFRRTNVRFPAFVSFELKDALKRLNAEGYKLFVDAGKSEVVFARKSDLQIDDRKFPISDGIGVEEIKVLSMTTARGFINAINQFLELRGSPYIAR